MTSLIFIDAWYFYTKLKYSSILLGLKFYNLKICDICPKQDILVGCQTGVYIGSFIFFNHSHKGLDFNLYTAKKYG
jgi:hypothetical protein